MFILVLILGVLLFVILCLRYKMRDKRDNNSLENLYELKPFMTKYEKYFYDTMLELETELNIKIVPQVNLGAIINKKDNGFRNELFRNIDFGIFSNDYEKLFCLVEINDRTHSYSYRRDRDIKVDRIVKSVGIELIKFYSGYSNEKQYIKDRITKIVRGVDSNYEETNC